MFREPMALVSPRVILLVVLKVVMSPLTSVAISLVQCESVALAQKSLRIPHLSLRVLK